MFRSLALLVPLLILVFSQRLAGQYYFHHLDQSTGLSSNRVSGIFQCRDGFIWLATTEGLARFDGSEVMIYRNDISDSLSLSDDYVLDICQDDQGMIWIGTLNGGINVLNPGTGTFRHYRHDDSDSTSLAFEFNKLVFKDEDGNIWVNVHDRGLDRFSSATNGFIHYLPGNFIKDQVPRLINSILCYSPDPENHDILWLGSMAGVLRLNKQSGEWTHYPLEEELSETPYLVGGKEKIIRSMTFGSHGELWLGTWGGGLCRLDTITGKFTVFKYEGMNPVHGARNSITALEPKSEEELWVCTENMGLAIFNTRVDTFRFVYDPDNLRNPVPYPFDILTSETGNLFVASQVGGLYYTNTQAHLFLKNRLPYTLYDMAFTGKGNDFMASVTGSDRKVILCTGDGKISKEYFADPSIGDPLEWIFKILPEKDICWLAGTKNLYYLDEKSRLVKIWPSFDPISVNQNRDHLLEYLSVTIDKQNNIWLGSKFNGIFVFNPQSNSIKSYYQPDPTVNSALFSEFIMDLYCDKRGNVWYGAVNFGYFDQVRQTFINLRSNDLTPSPGKSVQKIKDIAEDSKGNLWIGTQSNGIAVIRAGDSIQHIKSYDKSTGLADDMIRQVLIDHHDNAWIITYDGISRIRNSDGVVENYNIENGLSGIRRMTEAPDGSIYLTASGGFYRIFPDEVEPFVSFSKPYIKDVHTYTRPVYLVSADGVVQNVELDYKENNININFGMISYFRRNESNLKYMLEGLDKSWQAAGRNLSVNYASLPPGHYRFRLIAKDGAEISLPIYILAPYWKTWWFIVLVILMLISVISTIFTIRTRQIRKQEEIKASYQRKFAEQEVKTLRSQMNPHFLFNSLNSIRYYVLNNENENAADYITRFSRLLRLILANSRSELISLKDELHALRLYIEFEQMRFNRKFEYKLEVDEHLDSESIHIQPLTIQPFVENAIWHGLMPLEKDGQLLISIHKEDSSLAIIVRDNGIGREKSATLRKPNPTIIKSYGLEITRERMKLLGELKGKKSNFTIKDLFDPQGNPAGTEVKIVIEL